MVNLKDRNILIVAPHPDDEIIGCGGLIKRSQALGAKIHVLFLTVGTSQDYSSQGLSNESERRNEAENVAGSLGFSSWAFALPGDEFHLQLDQTPQREIINHIEKHPEVSLEATEPDIFIFPSVTDYNQDHRAASHAAFAAVRPNLRHHKHVPDLIMTYETPMDWWSQPPATRQPDLFVSLSESDLEAKVDAMHGYKSQVREHGHPRNQISLRALAALRGSTIGEPYAEGYYVHKFRLA